MTPRVWRDQTRPAKAGGARPVAGPSHPSGIARLLPGTLEALRVTCRFVLPISLT